MANYFPYGYQSYNNYQQSAPSMIWVRNAQEAAMYPVAPNNAVALWDSGVSCIYLKQADASGRPSMKIYDLVERKETPVEGTNASGGTNTPDYATKDELATLAKDTDKILASLREDVEKLKKEADNG